MNRLTMIKDKLIDPALNTSDIPALEKASAILRSVAETEKIETDLSTSARAGHSESLRFWIPIFAPVISALALIGTLVFQIQQFKQNSQLQTQQFKQNSQLQIHANEDTQWREALTHAKSLDGKESAFALTLIKSFFDSDRYKKQAREVAVIMLPVTTEPPIFQNNFEDLLERTDWDNFKDIVHLSNTLVAFYKRFYDRAENLETQRKQKQATFAPQNLQDDDIYTRDDFAANIVTTSKGLVQFLRDSQHHPRPSNIKLDLNQSALWDQDLSNIDFSGARLLRTWISNCSLNDANLSGAMLDNASIIDSSVNGADFSGVQANNSNWLGTAWWRAKRMSPKLLKYLQDRYKFSEEIKYHDDNTKDYPEYQKEVERLSKNQ